MPTIVGILAFMRRIVSCSVELSMKTFYKPGARGLVSRDVVHLIDKRSVPCDLRSALVTQ